MGKIRRVLRCYNCGAVLQSKKEKEIGFVPSEVLDSAPLEDRVIYCKSCFDRMKVINTGALELGVDKVVAKILDDAVATDAFIVWVVDIFAFNGTIDPEIAKKVKKLNVAVVATHRDLFTKMVKNESLVRYVNERFEECGIKPHSVSLIGSADEVDIRGLVDKLNTARAAHDVYIIGASGSGKSSLINKLLKNYENKTKWAIKTETYKGTNVKVLSIPITNSSFIYELPSISGFTSVVAKVEKEVQKMITPKKRIETHYRTLAQGEALAVGSLASFELIKGRPTQIKFYCAEGVEVRKMFSHKLASFIAENNKKRTVRPVSEHYTSFRDFDLFEYTMENDGQTHDISIEGLGWISFTAKGQTIRVSLPQGAALKESLGKIR